MKNATKEILTRYPKLACYIEKKEIPKDWTLLNENERAFASLARLFEYEETFDLNRLFKEIDSDWISFALERLWTYYHEDTYLTKTQKPLIIKNPSDLLSQQNFAELMNEYGYTMDVKKIHMYRKRGKLPNETAVIGGKPYWLKEEIETYIHDLRIKTKDSQ